MTELDQAVDNQNLHVRHEASFTEAWTAATGAPPAFTTQAGSAGFAAFLAATGDFTIVEAAEIAQCRASRAQSAYGRSSAVVPYTPPTSGAALSRRESVAIESKVCTRWAAVSLVLAGAGTLIVIGCLLANLGTDTSVLAATPLLIPALVLGAGVSLAERIASEVRHQSMRQTGTNGLKRLLTQGGEPMQPIQTRETP